MHSEAQHSTNTSVSSARDKKAAGAFRTISEVADELEVQQHVLRFWETKFSQVKPLKRGGGRRYYRPEDVDVLKKIHKLLYTDGYTIRGAQNLIKGLSKHQVADLKMKRPVIEQGNEASVVGRPENSSSGGDAIQGSAQVTQGGAHAPSDKAERALKEMISDLKELRDLLR